MHSTKWLEYCGLDAAEKNIFFEFGSRSSSHITMDLFIRPHAFPFCVLMNKYIVDIIIGNKMFLSEDLNVVSRSFQAVSVGCMIIGCWTVILWSSTGDARRRRAARQWKHRIYLWECCQPLCSFHMQNKTTDHRRNSLEKLGVLCHHRHGDTHGYRVLQYLQSICYKSAVHDLPLPTILVHGRHTREGIFNTFAKETDALYSDWCEKVFGASSDGELIMPERHQGVITWIRPMAQPGFIWVWCGVYQLNLCMQSLYSGVPDKFYSTFTWIVSYPREQLNFTTEERSQCLSFATRASSTWWCLPRDLTDIDWLSPSTSRRRTQLASRTSRGRLYFLTSMR